MPMRELTVFPDTNIFLHCRPIHDLPWHEVFEFDVLHLKIAGTVVDEIDRLKRDGNPRRAKRAREANSLFRQMLADPSGSVSLQSGGKSVVISFAPPLLANRTTPVTLDRTRGDDSLIEEALIYAQEQLFTVLLTGDTGVDLRARRHSLATSVIPDSWLLPAEPDERDKRIRELEQRVGKLEVIAPKLVLGVRVDGAAVRELQLTLPHYAPLTSDEIDGLMQQLRKKHPCATEFPDPPEPKARNEFEKRLLSVARANLIGVSKDEIAKYETEYASWEQSAQETFSRWANLLNAKYRWHQLVIEIDNTGAASAQHLLLEIELHNGLKAGVSTDGDTQPKLYNLAQHYSDAPVLKRPPNPPRAMSSWEKATSGWRSNALIDPFRVPHLPDYRGPVAGARDRHALYVREDEDELLASWSIECEEFRHGLGSRDIYCWVMVPSHVQPASSRLYLRATAANLPTAFEHHLPIDVSYEPRSTLAHAQRFSLDEAAGAI
jgi:hypothetical protein